MFLVAFLAQNSPTPPSSAGFQAAVQLASQGQDEQALDAFQRLAALDPNDREARLWVGRLLERMGHPDRAEPVYHSIILEDGTNVEATLGDGRALLALDRTKDAIEMLERAERLAPQNAETLVVLGDAHARAGHHGRALTYYRRAAALAPIDQGRIARERAERTYGNRVDARYSNEQFSDDTPTTNFGDVGVSLRVADALRLFGRGQKQKKFSFDEWRAGGGLALTWKGATTFTAHVLAASDTVVMPRKDYLGEVAHTFRGTTGALSLRYFDFKGANETVISPALTFSPNATLRVGLRYAFSVTDRQLVDDDEFGHTGQVQVSYQVRPRVAINLGAARGVEDFDNFSVDRTGKFVATTGSAGARVELRSMTAITGMYEYQRPHAGTNMGRASVIVTQGF